MTSHPTLDVEPELSEQEHILNEFTRKHPMLSSDVLNPDVLEVLDKMLERDPIQLRELPVVNKQYEDAMLRPANLDRGERQCNLDDKCLCMHMARIRYGPDNPYGFIGTEFLLPEQRKVWLHGGKLPEERAKCLVCNRYFTTYLYLMMRNNAHFAKLTNKFELQTHENTCAEESSEKPAKRKCLSVDPQPTECDNWHDKHSQTSCLPTHTNLVGVSSGYSRDCLLFTDDKVLQSPDIRNSSMADLAFRPFVRFSSAYFKYELNGSQKRLIQVNVSDQSSIHSRTHLNSQPPQQTAGPVVEEDDAVRS